MKVKNGQKIKISSIGEEATIVEELGSGGQGTVYNSIAWQQTLCNEMVLQTSKQDFYNNLKNKIAKGSRTSLSFGY